MYKYDYIVSIFSDDNLIENTLKEIGNTNRINFNYSTYSKLDEKKIGKSDIVIIDLDDFDLGEIKDNLKEDAKLVLCVDQFKKTYTKAEEIIFKPINVDIFKYQIGKLYEKISLEEELRYTNSCLNTTINGIPDMYWVKTLDGIHMLLNDKFCEVVGKLKEDVTGKDHYYIWNVSKDDPNSGADLCKKTEDEVIAAGHTLSFAESVKSRFGTRQLVTYKTPLYDKNNKVIGTVGFGHDITDLKNLSVENQILLNSIPYSVLIRNIEGRIEDVNKTFENFFNVEAKDVIGKQYDDWVNKTFYPDREENESGYIEGYIRTSSNDEQIAELRFDNIRDVFNNINGQICIFRDVTLERKQEKENNMNANVDFMTNLFNRRYLDKYISELSKDEMLTIFSIDLDHFKSINDTYGHKTGDEAIILVANILSDFFKDDLVVRMGGDEFLVVKVGDISENDAEKIAKKLLNTFTDSFESSKKFKILSSSVGIAQGPKNKFESILKNSDAALYDAKEAGRACYVIHK